MPRANARPTLPALALWLGLGLFAALPAGAETLKVGGTGSSAPLVALLFEAFRQQAPDAILDQVSPPLGSGGAVKALAGGHLDLAVTGRPLNPDEQARVGRDFELATTPFVFASAGGRKAKGFTLDEIADLYAGRFTHWNDGTPVRLVLRADFESDTQMLKAMSPAMARAVATAAQRPGMALGQNDLDTLDLLARTPGSFGPTTLGLLSGSDTRLATFPIDGVAPSVAALKNGTYPWKKVLYVVLPRQPGQLAEKFAAFLRSAPAHAVLLRHGYLPSDR